MDFIMIENKLVSMELFEEKFHCDYEACKGACCVEGDEGAPLENHEITGIEENLDQILPHLTAPGKMSIEQNGVFVKKSGESVKTPLIDGKACAFAVFENGKALCGIEKAYQSGQIKQNKPVSCHLYPVRINHKDSFEVLEYDRWDICSPACVLGKHLKKPVFQFVKDGLIRKYGKDFYAEMEAVYQQLVLKNQ